MKPIMPKENSGSRQTARAFKKQCVACCKRAAAQINKLKETIFAEARDALRIHDQMLRLVLNEAEALAWETQYPHLLFPALATEKVQALRNWAAHQRAVKRADPAAVLFA